MKKSIALLMAFMMVLSTAVGVYAAPQASQISPEAQALAAIGMLLGDSSAGVTPEYLAKPMTRLTAAILILRLKGLYSDAVSYTSDNNFPDAKNYIWKDGRNIMAYLKANPQIGFKGDPNGSFKPTENMTEQAYYKVLLETLGYRQTTTEQSGDFAWKDTLQFARTKGFQPSSKSTFVVNDLAIATVAALRASAKGGTKLIDTLVESGKINKQTAIEYGLYVEQVRAIEISSAAALNSRVIELTLKNAAGATGAAVVSVKDAAGNSVGVTAVELAPWSKDNKTMLVTLATDTNPGTLYTIYSGTTKANFGGKSKDIERPKVTKVQSIDFNEIVVTFSEPIKLQDAMFEFAEMYWDKAVLQNYAVRYEGRDKVLITTNEQKSATLYVGTIYNALDFAGNRMEKSENNIFVGISKSTEYLKLSAASANDYNQICMQFNVNVDPAYLSTAAFKLEEMYSPNSSVAVLSARLATTDDPGIYHAKLDGTAAKKHVILTIGSLRSGTLYKLSVEGLKTLYGRELSSSSSDRQATIAGISKPSTPFKINFVSSISNTKIKIDFERKVDPNQALNISNYAINESYMGKTPLPILAAEVNGSEVILTVGSMKNALYKLEVNNMQDIYGNNINYSNSANQLTFVGKAVADKIRSIVNIERISATVIRVQFDQNVGINATDVSLYYINNGIGYPEKAELVKADVANKLAMVELTIPKTAGDKVYKLYLKNLCNSDGVYMASSDEISRNFVGEGVSTTKAKIRAVIAADDQTLRVYFDRDVTDSTVKGKIWSGVRTPGNLYANVFKVSTNGDNTPEYDLDSISLDSQQKEDHTAYQDPMNADVLIIRLAVSKFKDSDSTAASKTFKMIVNTSLVQTEYNSDILEFSYNNSSPSMPELISAYAENSRSLIAYFSEPVSMSATPTDFTIYANEASTPIYHSGSQVRVIKAYPVKSTLHTNPEYSGQWKLVLDRDLLQNSTNVPGNRIVYLNIPASSRQVSDLSTFIALKPTEHRSYSSIPFAVNNNVPDNDGIVVETVYMPNKRTIDVYFSKEMDPEDVRNIANYQITANASGTTKADNNRLVQASDYSSADYRATLYLSEDIQTLTYNGGTHFNRYFLAIKSTVRDVTGISRIKAEESYIAFNSGVYSGIVMEFAPSTTTVQRPEISEVYAHDNRYAIDISFNQKVRFPAASDSNAKSFTDYAASLRPSEILEALRITARFEGESAQRTVTINDISNGTLSSNHEKLTIVFNRRLAARSSGSVTTEAQVSDRIKNQQNMSAINSGSYVSEGIFAVADSVYGDIDAPQLVTVSITSSNADKRYAKTGDTVTLSFTANEAIQIPTVTIAGNAAAVSGWGTNYTATYVMQRDDNEGNAGFSIQYRDLSGYPGVAASATSDGSYVTFDKTAPIISGVTANKVYGAEGVTPTFNEGTAKLNGIEYASGTKINAVGSYTLVVTDRAGNSARVAFEVKVAVQLTNVTIHANNKAYVKVGDTVVVAFNASQELYRPVVRIAGHQVEVDKAGTSYSASYVMKETDPEGVIQFRIEYRFRETDLMTIVSTTTNESRVMFDKSAPIIADLIADKVYNGSGVAPRFSEGTATLNGNGFSSGTRITEEGSYKLIVVDQAGNQTEISFRIDATPPMVTGVMNGEKYKLPVTPVFTEGTATLDGKPFISGTTITEVGSHTLVVTDQAGNSNTISFIIGEIAFGVKSSVMYDNYKNINGLGDFKEDHLGQDGVMDTVVITFNENIQYTVDETEWQLLLGTNYADVAGNAEKIVSVSGDKIAINFYKQDQKINTAASNSENGFELVYRPDENNKIVNANGEPFTTNESYIFENNNKYNNQNTFTIADGANPIIVSYNVNDGKGRNQNSMVIYVSETLYFKRGTILIKISNGNDHLLSIDKSSRNGTGEKTDFRIDRIEQGTKITGHIDQNVKDKSTSVSAKENLLFDQAGNGMMIRWVSDL